MLVGTDVSVQYPGADRPAVAQVSVDVKPYRLVAVVGPNGSGKTTLLRALMGTVALHSGRVELLGRPIGGWPQRERARIIGAVTQREEYPFAWRVDEVVSFGRYSRLSALAALSAADREAIERAMLRADVLTLAGRRIDTLSGESGSGFGLPEPWRRNRPCWHLTSRRRRSTSAMRWRFSNWFGNWFRVGSPGSWLPTTSTWPPGSPTRSSCSTRAGPRRGAGPRTS